MQVSPCQSVRYSDWVTCLTPPRAGAPYITGRLLPGRRKALNMLASMPQAIPSTWQEALRFLSTPFTWILDAQKFLLQGLRQSSRIVKDACQSAVRVRRIGFQS